MRKELDLSAIAGSYRSVVGQPPFDRRMMTVLLPCTVLFSESEERRRTKVIPHAFGERALLKL